MGKDKLLKKVFYNVSSDSDFEECPSKYSFSSHASSSRQSIQGKVRKSAQVLNSKIKKLKFDEDEVEEFQRVCEDVVISTRGYDKSHIKKNFNLTVNQSDCEYVRKSEFDKLRSEFKDFKNYVKMYFHHLDVKFVNEEHERDKASGQNVVGVSDSKRIQSCENNVSPVNVVGDMVVEWLVESEGDRKGNKSPIQVDDEDSCWPSDALLMVMYDQTAIEHPILQEKLIPESSTVKFSEVCDESNFNNSKSVKVAGEYKKSLYISESAENSKSKYERKRYFTLKHPFMVEIGNDVDFSLMSEFAKFVDKDTLKRFSRKKQDVYLKGKHEMKHAFVYGDIHIKSRDWFHRLSYGGRTIDDSHIDVVLYYLRKRAKYDAKVPIKFTTTDFLFSCKVKSMYNFLVRSNMDYGVINDENEILEYILGNYMLCSHPWDTVDHVLIPIYVDDIKHWILAIFTFKSKAIYIYDSIRGDAHDVKVRRVVEPFALLIPRLLVSTGFYSEKHDMDFNHPPFSDKSLLQSLDIRFVDDLPIQFNADCGVFLLSFAEYFIFDQQIPTDDFDIDQYRHRLSCLLWHYGRMKNIEQVESEPEFSSRTFKKKRNQN